MTIHSLLRAALAALALFSTAYPSFSASQVQCVTGDAWPERHAAEEFAKYALAITGRAVPVSTAPGGAGAAVSIGRSRLASDLIRSGAVREPSGAEEYVIKSAAFGGRDCLVLLGGTPRATLYAVYDYLERACKVGFFWDGEQIPRLKELPVKGLDIRESPRFAERQYLLSVVYGYTTYWWGAGEWKREVDWAAKHRLNLLGTPPGAVSIWKKVWKSFGVEVPDSDLSSPPFLPWASFHLWNLRPPYPAAFQAFQDELTKATMDYGHRLGLMWDSPSMAGIQVPETFYRAYQGKARFMDVPWHVFRKAKFAHPVDPLYARLWQSFMREHTERYGNDHFWFAPSFFEMRPGEDLPPAEQLALKLDIARKTLESTRAVDPKAVLVTLGWTFTDKAYWPKEHTKAFLESFPDDAIRVWDLWQDYLYPTGVKRPLYEQMDYYFGKPWLIGFLHSYGGNLSLHGDLADAARRVKQASLEPRARNCRGVAMLMEAIHHNHLYYDMLARLGWNPALDVDQFLADYALRRYGSGAAPAMTACLRELAASVYSTNDTTLPLYMRRLGTGARQFAQEALRLDGKMIMLTFAERAAFLPRLQRALEIALGESQRLGSSPMYQHDLIDVARQYLGDLFNVHAALLNTAFNKGDRQAFERHAAKLESILKSQEQLLSSSDYFQLQPILDKARALPGAPPDYDERIRDILTVWADGILDYAARDYFELVKFYYHPRVTAFVEHLRSRLGTETRKADPKQLTAGYHEIEQNFVKHPFKVGPGDRFRGSVADAARGVLAAHGLRPDELNQLLASR